MTPKLARQVLLTRRPDGSDDDTRTVKAALAAAESDPTLAQELALQEAFDREASQALQALGTDEPADEAINHAKDAMGGEHGGLLHTVKNPALVAVALGFLLMIAVLTWHFLGESGAFPDEAGKISSLGGGAAINQFEVVDNPVGQLQDWFMLKSFDSFLVPAGLEKFHAVGVRIFKYDGEAVSQVAVDGDRPMFFYCFPAQPFGINVKPEGSWAIAHTGKTVMAIREEKSVCFMVTFEGTEQQMKTFLGKL